MEFRAKTGTVRLFVMVNELTRIAKSLRKQHDSGCAGQNERGWIYHAFQKDLGSTSRHLGVAIPKSFRCHLKKICPSVNQMVPSETIIQPGGQCIIPQPHQTVDNTCIWQPNLSRPETFGLLSKSALGFHH
jgi:hypothetical protein